MRFPKPIKKIAKQVQALLPFAVGKNEWYDRQTKKIIAQYCNPDSVCIDIGANEGKILKWMVEFAPKAKHYAFEPIPSLFQSLKEKYRNSVHLYPIALSNRTEKNSFNFVTTDTAFSGIKKRPYPNYYQQESIEVMMDRLDNIIPETQPIFLIKIDVEGGEWNVLNGAKATIIKNKPLILFECGKIGGELYGFNDSDMYKLFSEEFEYNIFSLTGEMQNKSLSAAAFNRLYENGKEYFFLAVPKSFPNKA